MIVRIVKMGFDESKVNEFLQNFEVYKNSIRNFQGCQFLELYQDRNNSSTFFTYSHWDSESALERYRQSELFKSVWAETKQLFNTKPQAWSVNKLESLK